jgi:cell division cycle 14
MEMMPTGLVVLPDRVVFSAFAHTPVVDPKQCYVAIAEDESFRYQPFFTDFGPLSLLSIHRFGVLMEKSLKLTTKIIHLHCPPHQIAVTNSVLLLSTFRMIHLDVSPEEAFRPFLVLMPMLRPYRDASPFPTTYDLTIPGCLHGLHRAMSFRWYDPDQFDSETWAHDEIVANGDMNWLVPNKLLAFASPYNKNQIFEGWTVSTPRDLVPKFQKMGITKVIRLCKSMYDASEFTKAGIKHTELYFDDGTVPSPSICQNFLKIVEGPDIVALHCKAGLGRTYVYGDLVTSQAAFSEN